MVERVLYGARRVALKSNMTAKPVEVPAIGSAGTAAHNATVIRFPVQKLQMPRLHEYSGKNTDVPGCNVYRLRVARNWSMRQLGDRCNPPLDPSTIHRVENNLGYSSDTLDRIATALKVKVSDLFLPPELLGMADLPDDVRVRLVGMVQDAVDAHQARTGGKKDRYDAG